MGKACRSIQGRVLILSLLFTALIALSVFVASLASLYRSTLRANAQSTEYNLQTLARTLQQNVREIDSLADWCTVNSTVRSYVFATQPESQLLNIYNTLLNKYSSQVTARYLLRVLVTDGSERMMQQGTAVAQSLPLDISELTLLPGFSQAGGETDLSWKLLADDPLLQHGHKQIIPVTRTMTNPSGTRTAVVYLAVSSDLILDALKDYTLTEGCTLFWWMNGQAWQLQDGALQPLNAGTAMFTLADKDQLELLDPLTHVYTAGENLVLAYPLGTHSMFVAQTLPDPVIQGQLPAMLIPILWALAAIFLLGAVLALLLRHMIAAPVQALQTQLQRIGDGDFAPNPAIEWDNEMGDIGRGINRLSQSVSTLMEKRLDDELQKKDLEYRMLQNQINPHFIYNTLNSIKWMATIQHAPGIAEMTMALSRLLKSVSKGNERLVPLQEEFALLNDYFTIQQYRYGGTITLDVTYIEDERLTQTCYIPRFTLQPLVENAIFHGIEPKGCPGSITLTVAREAATGDVLIDLCDDGVGMTAEQTARALSEPGPEEETAKFRHVGLWNVHRRLQYSFGERYGLTIRSTPGQGTTVEVRLPGNGTAKGELP